MDNLTPNWLEELLKAVGSHLEAEESEAAIVVGQDTSEHFPKLIQDVITHVRRDLQRD